MYEALGQQIGKLVTEKQAAYGDSFNRCGDVMRILYPNGIAPEQMEDALCVTRIVDKLFRIATKKDAFGESPYRDIAGYALLGVARSEPKKEVEIPWQFQRMVERPEEWDRLRAGQHLQPA